MRLSYAAPQCALPDRWQHLIPLLLAPAPVMIIAQRPPFDSILGPEKLRLGTENQQQISNDLLQQKITDPKCGMRQRPLTNL